MSDTDNKIDFKCNRCVYQLKSDNFVNLCSKKDQPYGIECQSKDFIGFKQAITEEQKKIDRYNTLDIMFAGNNFSEYSSDPIGEWVKYDDIKSLSLLTTEQKAKVLKLCDEVTNIFPNMTRRGNIVSCPSCHAEINISKIPNGKNVMEVLQHRKYCIVPIAKQLKEEL